MVKQVSFIHAADLHLDSPFTGLAHVPESIFKEIRDSTFTALHRLISTAIKEQVDFILLVGDLFDNEKQSLKAQIHLRNAFQELKKHDIYVYMSYGNHDHINGNVHPITYPDNVFIFQSEKVSAFTYSKENKLLAEIHGFSYESRSVIEKKVHEFQIENEAVPFHIAMLHGSLQSNTDHDTYAPFQLGDLLAANMDYWALGHIHQKSILKEDPTIIYPGNIQGRNRKETGEKGCYHIVMSEVGVEQTFIPLQAIQFITLQIDVSTCKEVHQLEAVIQAEIKKMALTTPLLIDLKLTSEKRKLHEWESEQLLEEVIDIINEQNVRRTDWYYIFRYRTEVNQEFNETWEHSDHFIGELSRQIKQKDIQSYLTPLFNHSQGKKYISSMSEEEQMNIKKEAQKLLMHGLLGKGGI